METQEQGWGIRIRALVPEIPSLQGLMPQAGWKTRVIIEAERLTLGTEQNELMCDPGGRSLPFLRLRTPGSVPYRRDAQAKNQLLLLRIQSRPTLDRPERQHGMEIKTQAPIWLMVHRIQWGQREVFCLWSRI